jgi:hypothetical protein
VPYSDRSIKLADVSKKKGVHCAKTKSSSLNQPRLQFPLDYVCSTGLGGTSEN